MMNARQLAAALLEAPGRARDYIKKAGQTRPTGLIQIKIGHPLTPQVIHVPVHWQRDLVMRGHTEHPGVVLRGNNDTPDPPAGVTPESWDWILEIIEYALNEGPIFADVHSYDPEDEEDRREGGTWTPQYEWAFLGGREAYERECDRAYTDAPSWRQ